MVEFHFHSRTMLKDTGTTSAPRSTPPDSPASPTETRTESRVETCGILQGRVCGELSAELNFTRTTSTSSSMSEDSGMVSDLSVQSSTSSSNCENETSISRITEVKTKVTVAETISSTDNSGSKVTLFKVDLESNNICFHLPSSCVWRPYSEFAWLRKRLVSSCSFTRKSSIPYLPSRNLLNLFDKDFDVRRKEGLQLFLEEVVEDRSFMSDAALHLFLQSNLSTEEIQAWLDKKVDDPVIELIQRGKELVTQNNRQVQSV